MNVALHSLMSEPLPRKAAEPGGGPVAFLLVGGSAAAGFVVLSSVMVTLLPMVEAWLVSTACYAACIVPVYFLHRHFTFASDVAHGRALPRYVAVQIMAVLLASVFSFIFHSALELPSLVAAILVTGLTSGVNYLVLKSWAFAFERGAEVSAA